MLQWVFAIATFSFLTAFRKVCCVCSSKIRPNIQKEKGYLDPFAVFGQVDADYNVTITITTSNKEN